MVPPRTVRVAVTPGPVLCEACGAESDEHKACPRCGADLCPKCAPGHDERCEVPPGIRRSPIVDVNLSRAAALCVSAAVLLAAGGCQVIGDAVAKLIGAPTSIEIREAQQELDAAERQVEDLQRQAAAAERQAAAADAAAAAAEVRKAELRTLYGEMAGQLARLEGTAADALLQGIRQVEQLLHVAGREGQAWAQVAAGFRSSIAEIATAQEEARAEIGRAEASLQGFHEQTQFAIQNTLAGVSMAGDAAQQLGVPGAKLATDAAVGWMRTGLELLLLGGAGAGATLARRRARQRNDEVRRAETERERRERLGRVVVAVEQFGLIKDDEGLREGAKRFAGPEAHRELKRVLAEHALGPLAPAAGPAAA